MKALIAMVVLGLAAMGAGYGADAATDGKGCSGGTTAQSQPKVARWSGYIAMLRPKTIKRKLADERPTEEQLARIKMLREEVLEKVQAWGTRPEVMEARAEYYKAKKAGDKEALKVAEAKLKEVGDGSEFVKAYKDGLAELLSESQMETLYPPRKVAEKTADAATE